MNVDVASRLEGQPLPAVSLPSTDGMDVALDGLRGGWAVLFTYAKNMVDMPGVTRPDNWDRIAGAPG